MNETIKFLEKRLKIKINQRIVEDLRLHIKYALAKSHFPFEFLHEKPEIFKLENQTNKLNITRNKSRNEWRSPFKYIPTANREYNHGNYCDILDSTVFNKSKEKKSLPKITPPSQFAILRRNTKLKKFITLKQDSAKLINSEESLLKNLLTKNYPCHEKKKFQRPCSLRSKKLNNHIYDETIFKRHDSKVFNKTSNIDSNDHRLKGNLNSTLGIPNKASKVANIGPLTMDKQNRSSNDRQALNPDTVMHRIKNTLDDDNLKVLFNFSYDQFHKSSERNK